MLIYNFQKEFLGIDETDLEIFGFSNLAQLREVSADFADLFVKTPGYIHNFKHVHWIDFITCSDSIEDSKVIIHVNNKNFRAILDIKTIYLVDNPSEKAYQINLTKLRELSQTESAHISEDITQKSVPAGAVKNKIIATTPFVELEKEEKNKEIPKIVLDPYEIEDHEDAIKKSTSNTVEDIYEKDTFELKEDKAQDVKKIVDEPKIELDNIHKTKETTPSLEDMESDYIYDPHIASDELGLPLDLIEEFIQDFINQADDFKNELYTSLKEMNYDNVKILSHKLKGVAANLRIENAFKVLTIVNTSNDFTEVKSNLDKFYKIISKLSGKEIEKEVVEPKIQNDIQDNDFVIDLEDDEIVENSQIPEKIEMAELADDEFLNKKKSDFSSIGDTNLVIESDALDSDNLFAVEDDIEIKEDIEEVDKNIIYNKNSVASEIGIDLKNFNQLLNDFLTESKICYDNIQKAIRNNDFKMWNKSAMKLKGMSENMRIHDISQDLKLLSTTKDIHVAKDVTKKISDKLEQISKVKG